METLAADPMFDAFVTERVTRLSEGLVQRIDTLTSKMSNLEEKAGKLTEMMEAAMEAQRNEIEETITARKDEFDKEYVRMKQELKDMIADLTTKTTQEAGGGGGGNKYNKLVNPKETSVEKLHDDIVKGDFTDWVEELYVHLDSLPDWKGTSELLKVIRFDPVELTEESLKKHVLETHHKDNIFDMLKFDTMARDRDLYAYLLRKLNKKLKGMVAGTKSGFEVFRIIVREEDPVTTSTEYNLRFAFQQLVFKKCSDLGATKAFIQILDRKIKEFQDKVGKPMDEVLKTTVLHGAMDPDTAREARRTKVETTYSGLKSFVMELHQEEMGRNYVHDNGQKPKGTNGDIGALGEARDNGEDEGDKHLTDNAMDSADTKGKGKGGKGVTCRRCAGTGHFERDCPTPGGSTADHQCHLCNGKGHFARDHQDAGGKGKGGKGQQGQYTKGGGKNGGGKFGDYKGGSFKGKGTYGKDFGFYQGGKGKGSGWGSGKGLRSMSTPENKSYGMMTEPEFDWSGHAGAGGWSNSIDNLEQAPWACSQQPASGNWQGGGSWGGFGGLYSMTLKSAPKNPSIAMKPNNTQKSANQQILRSKPTTIGNQFSVLTEPDQIEEVEEEPQEIGGNIRTKLKSEIEQFKKAQKEKKSRAQKDKKRASVIGYCPNIDPTGPQIGKGIKFMTSRCISRCCSTASTGSSGTRSSQDWPADVPRARHARPETADSQMNSLMSFDYKSMDTIAISHVGEYREWKEIEVTIDSGACETVMPLSMCSEMTLHESEQQRKGVEYEVANGSSIPNEGERRCLIMTMGAAQPKQITSRSRMYTRPF